MDLAFLENLTMVEKLTLLENLGNQCDLILDEFRNLYINSPFIYEYLTSTRRGGVHRGSMKLITNIQLLKYLNI